MRDFSDVVSATGRLCDKEQKPVECACVAWTWERDYSAQQSGGCAGPFYPVCDKEDLSERTGKEEKD